MPDLPDERVLRARVVALQVAAAKSFSSPRFVLDTAEEFEEWLLREVEDS